MKARTWAALGVGSAVLLLTAGCDVHRTDPVPEISAVVGDSELDRTRPDRDVRTRQSRIDTPPNVASDAPLNAPSSGIPGTPAAPAVEARAGTPEEA